MLLERCTDEQVGDDTTPLTPARRDELAHTIEELGAEGYRTLGVAWRGATAAESHTFGESAERNLTFLGVVALLDPPREEAAAAIAEAHRAGIRTVMITGDHPVTAARIAADLGISGTDSPVVVTGRQVDESDDEELAARRRRRPRVRAGGPRTQVAGGRRAAGRTAHRGDDRRRRQRRAGAEVRGHRRGDGHHRHRRHEGSRADDPGRRQLRHDRGRGPPGTGHLRQHPQVHALPAELQHGRDRHRVPGRDAGWRHRPGGPVGTRAPRSFRCWPRRSCGSTWSRTRVRRWRWGWIRRSTT